MRAVVLLVAVAGCQQVFGLDDTVHVDAGVDATTALVVTGQTYSLFGGSVGMVAVSWETDPGQLLAMDTSDGNGMYRLAIPYAGVPVDGHLHTVRTGYLDTYYYLAGALGGDAIIDIPLMSQDSFMPLCTQVQVSCDATKAFLYFVVFDATGKALAGATVTTAPAGTVRYNDNGSPSASATATSSDGGAFVFNIPIGTISVDAAAVGWTFLQRTMFARAGALNLTYLVGQPAP